LGQYVGALENWVTLQETYQNFHLIADYHVLTTQLETSHIAEYTLEMLKDWLAAGIDPEQSPIFRQSQIKEHAELFLILSMLITSARLERNPTLKEQVRDLDMENVVYGHLGYPVLQAADILLYKGELVPVGEDQAPHVEISRELARKFNRTYGEVFPEPKALLSKFARLPGLDGQAKMSKSLGNAILLSDEPEIMEIRAGCESGSLGCVECKRRCGQAIADHLAPFRERRRYYDDNQGLLADILQNGEARANSEAKATMSEVHQAMELG